MDQIIADALFSTGPHHASAAYTLGMMLVVPPALLGLLVAMLVSCLSGKQRRPGIRTCAEARKWRAK